MIDSCRNFVLRKTIRVDPKQATPEQMYNANRAGRYFAWTILCFLFTWINNFFDSERMEPFTEDATSIIVEIIFYWFFYPLCISGAVAFFLMPVYWISNLLHRFFGLDRNLGYLILMIPLAYLVFFPKGRFW